MKAKSRRPVARNNQLPQGVRNTPAAKAEPAVEEQMVLQFGESEVAVADISGKVKAHYQEGGNEAAIKKLQIYVKPEDNKAYYVVNDEITGDVDLA